MSTYTIGQVALRSGFTTSALRYYEGIGLVTPVARTSAGYRVYDDVTLARLAFIARAKQLGCSLEEVTDLVAICDGERCGPVQQRFHELAGLVAAEQRCCAFFTFAITVDARGVGLEVTAPPGAEALLDSLLGAAA